jgi:hypothetical protein
MKGTEMLFENNEQKAYKELAVIAADESGSVFIMWHRGAGLDGDIPMVGPHADDIGLNVEKDIDTGLAVWEGASRWVGSEDAEIVYTGKVREPTDEEWAAIREGRNPWPEEDYENGEKEKA